MKVLLPLVLLGLSSCTGVVSRSPSGGTGAHRSHLEGADIEKIEGVAPSISEPSGAISLVQAENLALGRSPSLRVADADLRKAEAEMLSAVARPNPSMDAEVENFLGGGEFRGIRGAEETLALTHTIERGGKRELRQETATAGIAKAQSSQELVTASLRRDVAFSFHQLLAAQQHSELARDQLAAAEEFAAAQAERFNIGAIPQADRDASQVAVSLATVELADAENVVDVARIALASTWGSAEPRFSRAVGSLPPTSPPPPLGSLRARLDGSLLARHLGSGIRLAEAEAALAHANAKPDWEVTGGVRHFEGEDSFAGVLGMSIPIPVFDTNKGGIASAEAGRQSAAAQHDAGLTALEARLAQEHAAAERGHLRAASLKKALGQAEANLALVSDGYANGLYPYAALNDSRSAVWDIRSQMVSATIDHHLALVEIDHLISSHAKK